MKPQKSALGKGLDALLPETEERTEVAIEQIKPRPDQPRQAFPEKALMELAYSIRMHGILQPLVVAPGDDGFVLIAGERRLRAAKIAGLRNVPVFVRSVDAQNHYELALIENLQRADLSPLEEARAYRKLMTDFNLTQDDLAKRLGKSRSKIANTLRLLQLPSELGTAVEQGTITPGHANALLSWSGDEQRQLFNAITTRNLTVRQAEAWRPASGGSPAKAPPDRPAWLVELERRLGTKVTRKGSDQRGRLVIEYHSTEELNGLLDRLQ